MNKLIASIAVFGLLAFVALPAIAVTTGEVSATVTPAFVSITVENGSVDYGTLGAGETNNTFNGDATADTQTITNVGTVSTDIALRSSDADVAGNLGVADWDLAGIATDDVFVHSYDTDNNGSWTVFPSDGAFANTNTATVETLASNGNTTTLDLKLDMPTSITNTAVHSIAVTVLATATTP